MDTETHIPYMCIPHIDTHTDIYAHRHIENRYTIQAPPTYRHTNTLIHIQAHTCTPSVDTHRGIYWGA